MRDLLYNGAHVAAALNKHFEKRFVCDDTHDIIKAFLIYRQTGVHLPAENLLYLVDSRAKLHADDLDTGNKYLVYGYLVKFQCALYKLALLLLDDTLLLYLVYHVFQLVFGNAGSFIALG